MNFATANIGEAIHRLEGEMRWAREVPVEKWHGVSTAGKPDLVSLELPYVSFRALNTIDPTWQGNPVEYLRQTIQPNLPWADDHFAERVGRVPLNPGEQYKNWPHYPGSKIYDQEFRSAGGKFTHSYMERFWPKFAGEHSLGETYFDGDHHPADCLSGVRYKYGDLDDLVALLYHEPYTRQAWLPVWFPEDTGVLHGGRVPCTIGYHFMYRYGRLNMTYVIRSCDIVRYLRDDLYMAARLLLWVLEELSAYNYNKETEMVWADVEPGLFMFHCFSLHKFKGDEYVPTS